MGQSFLIEVNGKAIGVAVSEADGFKFFNFDPRYQALENFHFESLDSVVASANEFERSFLGGEDSKAGSPLEPA